MYSQDSKGQSPRHVEAHRRRREDRQDVGRARQEPCAAGRQPRPEAAAGPCASSSPTATRSGSKAMEMARGGASCRKSRRSAGIRSPDVVRYWLKGGGTKGVRMGGRARTPEGDEPAYAGFEGGLERGFWQLELENDILRGAVDLLKQGASARWATWKTVLIDKLRLESDRPLKRAHRFLEDLEELLWVLPREAAREGQGTPSSGPTSGGYSTGAGGAGLPVRTTSCGRRRRRRREGRAQADGRKERGCKVAYLKRRRRWLLQRGDIGTRPQPGEAQLPRGRAEQAAAHRHPPSSKLPSERRRTSAPVIDCFDHLVVAWRIGRRPSAALANGSLDACPGQLAPGQRPVCARTGCHCRWPGLI